jgi:hypothetical protein
MLLVVWLGRVQSRAVRHGDPLQSKGAAAQDEGPLDAGLFLFVL